MYCFVINACLPASTSQPRKLQHNLRRCQTTPALYRSTGSVLRRSINARHKAEAEVMPMVAQTLGGRYRSQIECPAKI